jgi:hypothetical protein
MSNITKSTYTNEHDRDGIFVTRGGSNCVYKGFSTIKEARDYAKELGDPWHVWLNGTYKSNSNDL